MHLHLFLLLDYVLFKSNGHRTPYNVLISLSRAQYNSTEEVFRKVSAHTEHAGALRKCLLHTLFPN